MTSPPRRALNDAVTRFWSVAARGYDLPVLQQWVYRPAQTEAVEVLRTHGARRIADVACGTGILADRIERELHPDEIYGVDMSDGMLAQARQRSSAVTWRKGPAEQLPFDDGALDAVVSTSAFHFFDQPAALREFHRVLRPGGMAAVATMSPWHGLPLPAPADNRLSVAHSPSPRAVRQLFEDAGFQVSRQHRVRRQWWTQAVSDLITVGIKAP
jgi:ubiquinone/menaquinone biosynthesis C-methylase UbiE